MDNYTEILGHEPSEMVRQMLPKVEEAANKLHNEYPDLPMVEIWGALEEAANIIIARRYKAESETQTD